MSYMTEETNSKETSSEGETTTPTPTAAETPPVPKVLIDKPSDFRFHAAYMTYSDAFDKATSPETKQKLNESITALSSEQIDYETFYRQISQYRAEFNPDHFGGRGRPFIETQRKKDWRRREERASRNKRHGR
jgi:hypothetical protein